MQAELSAMRDIALVLAELDETTRARVIKWATERFGRSPAVPTQPQTIPVNSDRAAVTAPIDPIDALSVDSLDDLFDEVAPKAPHLSSLDVDDAIDGPGESVAGMVHEFVTEFQEIVRQWNGACDEATARPVAEPAAAPAAEPRLSLVTKRPGGQRTSSAV
ncbi:MAG TPA: hypothetical protein VGG73_01450 [Vicinamibacterales bacterium]